MVFDYYYHLSAEQQESYRKSDSLTSFPLKGLRSLRHAARELQKALENANKTEVQRCCQHISEVITSQKEIPSVRIKVMAVRPRNDVEELHGYYVPIRGRRKAQITLWMRTARQKKVVAYRSFLRTLLHELLHHIDYEFLLLDDTFHTEGFYKRESSMFYQLLPKNTD